MKKIQPGDPLRIPASTFNTMIDAAEDYLRRQQSRHRRPQLATPAPGVVRVKNTTDAPVDRFAVLGIDEPLYGPSDNLLEFQNCFALEGVTPDASQHTGRFVILAEPLPVGAIGRGYIYGVCPVRVNVTDAEHAFADVEDGQTARLTSAQSGAAQILWAEEGTGVQWALVRLCRPCDALGLLPEVPDPEKDYVLGYDGTTQALVWVETTDECPE
jgi:hypothetical protein